MKRLLVALFVAALGIFALASKGDASSPYACTWITGGTIYGNVTVPSGQKCSLDGATVTGAVTVQAGGGLVIIDGSKICKTYIEVMGGKA